MPVRGPDSASRAEVTDELQRLARELAIGVCIDRVRTDVGLREGDGTHADGTYDPVLHGVRLDADLRGADLRRTLRHEVCHGIDVQNDLVKHDEDAFVYPNPPPVRRARHPAEAFADTCELGREALGAIGAVSCPDDPDLRAARIVAGAVYAPMDEHEPGAVFDLVASFRPGPLEGAVTDLVVRPAEEPGALVVSVHHGGWLLRALVDAYTGTELDGVPLTSTDLPLRSVPGATASADACPAPAGWAPRFCGTTADGVEITVADLELPTGILRRAHALTAQGFRSAAGPDGTACVAEATSMFSFDGELWSGHWVGEAVVWGRWGTP